MCYNKSGNEGAKGANVGVKVGANLVSAILRVVASWLLLVRENRKNYNLLDKPS